jgi:hypothetical protein
MLYFISLGHLAACLAGTFYSTTKGLRSIQRGRFLREEWRIFGALWMGLFELSASHLRVTKLNELLILVIKSYMTRIGKLLLLQMG